MLNPLDGIERIDWASIPSGYGDGAEVRDLLHQVAGSPPGRTRDEAIEDLIQCLVHQGTVSPATSHALPFVVELARTDPSVREHMLALVACCAHPFTRFSDGGTPIAGPDDPARVAVRELLPRLAEIGDLDPASRPWVAACLGQFPESGEAHREQLRRWHDEAAGPAPAALYALALICLHAGTPSLVREVERQREEWDEDVDQDVLAALLANRSQPDRDFARIGGLLWDVAILSR